MKVSLNRILESSLMNQLRKEKREERTDRERRSIQIMSNPILGALSSEGPGNPDHALSALRVLALDAVVAEYGEVTASCPRSFRIVLTVSGTVIRLRLA